MFGFLRGKPKEIISLDKFVPKWTKYVKEDGFKKDTYRIGKSHGLDITSALCCVVGEAHGDKDWKNSYVDDKGKHYCEECKMLALGYHTINGIGFIKAIKNMRDFNIFKEGLYNHFTDEHPKRLRK